MSSSIDSVKSTWPRFKQYRDRGSEKCKHRGVKCCSSKSAERFERQNRTWMIVHLFVRIKKKQKEVHLKSVSRCSMLVPACLRCSFTHLEKSGKPIYLFKIYSKEYE
jgi:hypothetical protein